MHSEHLFEPDNLADKIALLAIYIPILRQEVQAFARMWNMHTIRKQPNRPNAVHGKPIMLYFYPQDPCIQNYGLKPDPQLLQELTDQTASYGMMVHKLPYC